MADSREAGGLGNGSILLIPALILGFYVGMQGIAMMPFLIGLVVDRFAVSEATGGYMASIQLGASAFASLTVAPRLNRLNRRRLFLGGAIASCIVNLASAAILALDSLPMIFVLRGLDGIAQGIIIATVSAIAAGTTNPIRAFAFMNGGLAVTAGILFIFLPYVLQSWQLLGLFGLMALLAGASSTIAVSVPPYYAGATTDPDAGSDMASSADHPVRLTAWVVLLAFLFFTTVTGGVWAYVERIGVNAVGLDITKIGRIVSVAAFLMVAGPYLANYTARFRPGRTLVVTLSCAAYLGVAIGLSLTTVVWLYALCVVSHTVVSGFAVTFLSALFAELDPLGRIAAASPAFNTIGNAVGPAIAGATIPMFNGYAGIGLMSSLLLVCSLAVFVFVIRSIDRARSLPSSTMP